MKLTEDLPIGAQLLPVVGHVGPDFRKKPMEEPHALAALAALGQATRLAIFRLLVREEPNGMSAGALAQAVGCPQNTLSTHIAILARAGLVHGTREGRTISYKADATGTRAFIAFLVRDCCEGRPELCGLAAEAQGSACACAPTSQQQKKRAKKAVR